MDVTEPAKLPAMERLQRLRANSSALVLAIALFYVMLPSGFEKLDWRGFVFRGLNEHLSTEPASDYLNARLYPCMSLWVEEKSLDTFQKVINCACKRLQDWLKFSNSLFR